jgi:repressor LexA
MTKQQRRMLSIIDERIRADGVSPSFEELRQGMGLASKSAVHRILGALEREGHISRSKYFARAIRINHQSCPHCGGAI